MKKTLLICLLLFIILFILFYLYNFINIKSCIKKNKNRFIFSIKYLMARFKLPKNVLIQGKMIILYSLVDTFIVTLVFMIIDLTNLPFYLQLIIGFTLLFGLIYAIYELIGRNLKRKEEER